MQKTDNKKNVPTSLALFAFVFSIVKSTILPFVRTAKFVGTDLAQSAQKDSIKVFAISALGFLSIILVVFIWITLGAGIIVYFLFPAALQAWGYLLLFELLSLFFFALIIWLLKKSMSLPDSIERAKKLFNLK